MPPHVHGAVAIQRLCVGGARFVDVIHHGGMPWQRKTHGGVAYKGVVVLVDGHVCAHARVAFHEVVLCHSHGFAYAQGVALAVIVEHVAHECLVNLGVKVFKHCPYGAYERYGSAGRV